MGRLSRVELKYAVVGLGCILISAGILIVAIQDNIQANEHSSYSAAINDETAANALSDQTAPQFRQGMLVTTIDEGNNVTTSYLETGAVVATFQLPAGCTVAEAATDTRKVSEQTLFADCGDNYLAFNPVRIVNASATIAEPETAPVSAPTADLNTMAAGSTSITQLPTWQAETLPLFNGKRVLAISIAQK
jgi:hypothetical protein